MIQPPLPLGFHEALRQSDFVLDDSNIEAATLLAQWPAWPAPILLILGPEGSGKTHLARIVEQAAGAGALTVVDGLEAGCDQARLFHLLNAAIAGGMPVLVAARADPALMPELVADVRSRLSLAARATIEPPGDALLSRLIDKRLRDHGLIAPPAVVTYVAGRIERSHAAVHAAVRAIDRHALSQRREVTVPLVREALGLL